MSNIDITGIDKAELLAALYNGTRAIGMGVLHDLDDGMTIEKAQEIIDTRMEGCLPDSGKLWFDYVCGRPIKVNITGDVMERADLYDRDAGPGAAQRVVDQLRGEEVT